MTAQENDIIAPHCISYKKVGGFKILSFHFGGEVIKERDILCTLKSKDGAEIAKRYIKEKSDDER